MTTRHTRISARKWAFQGDEYASQWVGIRVMHTTYDGDRIEGVIESLDGSGFPIIRFADGRWARGDSHIEVVA